MTPRSWSTRFITTRGRNPKPYSWCLSTIGLTEAQRMIPQRIDIETSAHPTDAIHAAHRKGAGPNPANSAEGLKPEIPQLERRAG